MLEELNLRLIKDVDPAIDRISIEWEIDNPSSVYAAEMMNNRTLLIGGSTWNRKSVPYTTKLARETPGIIYPASIRDVEIQAHTERQIQFPTMVNSIVPLGEN